MSDFDHLTEPQQIALTFLTIVEDKRIHQVRCDALRAYADQALDDPAIATAVRNILRYRRENAVHRNVVQLRIVR